MLNKTLETYESKEIFLSFNGGKDCTVLLHMFASLFTKRYPNESMLCLYIQPESPFDEIEDFIRECEQTYRIQVETIRGTVKAALFEICQRYPHLKAVVMGCRRTDPYCSDLNEFQVKLRILFFAFFIIYKISSCFKWDNCRIQQKCQIIIRKEGKSYVGFENSSANKSKSKNFQVLTSQILLSLNRKPIWAGHN